MIDISVVIPCYNAAGFIDDCIGSIAAQKDVAVEVIAVEDCSADDTLAKLRALAARHEFLTVHALEKNGGQAQARNIGMSLARGRYVALLDSDDQYIGASTLRSWLDAAEAGDLDLCISQFRTLRPNGEIASAPHVPPIEGGVGSALTAPQIVNTAQCWQILYSREFLSRTGVRFSERLRQREDRLFFIEAFLKADRIGVVPLETVLYRAHPNSTMKRVDYDQLAQFNIHMEIMAEDLREARDAGRVHPDFERANAVAYWRQALYYWRRLIREALEPSPSATPADIEIGETFLKRLHELTAHCGPLYRDRYFNKGEQVDGPKAEAEFDVARLAIAANRRDLMSILFAVGHPRIHHSQLVSLVAESGYDWAEAAITHSLKYNRRARFDQETASAGKPRLSSLVKRVVLHIGAPKTGSSAMQEFLEDNRFRLWERGVHYPMHGAVRERGARRVRSAGHLFGVREILSGRGASVRAALVAEIEALPHPVETLVLSSENILSHLCWPDAEAIEAGVNPNPIATIVKALGLETVEIAATLRRQDDWFASFYREVTSNPVNTFLETPEMFFENLEGRGLFDYEALFRRLEAAPYVSRIHIDSFGAVRAMGGSIPWMMKILGVPMDGLRPEPEDTVNESVTDAVAANLRLLKLYRPERYEMETIFPRLLADEALANSDYSLIDVDAWRRFDRALTPHLDAFDARFPGERPARRPNGRDAPLPFSPILRRQPINYLPFGRQTQLELAEERLEEIRRSVVWRVAGPVYFVERQIRWAVGKLLSLRK